MPQNNMVSFNNILVNAIYHNSGIFVGTNSQGNWNSSNNNKSGFGSILGTRNIVSHAVNIFMDNDVIDTPIFNGAALLPNTKGKDNITIYGCHRIKKEQAD